MNIYDLEAFLHRYVLKNMKKTGFRVGQAPPVRPVRGTGQTGASHPTPNLEFSQCVQQNFMDL